MYAEAEMADCMSDEVPLPTFGDLVERFKNFLRDVLSNEDEEPPASAVIAVRQFEATLITNTEMAEIESNMNPFITAYDEVIGEDSE